MMTDQSISLSSRVRWSRSCIQTDIIDILADDCPCVYRVVSRPNANKNVQEGIDNSSRIIEIETEMCWCAYHSYHLIWYGHTVAHQISQLDVLQRKMLIRIVGWRRIDLLWSHRLRKYNRIVKMDLQSPHLSYRNRGRPSLHWDGYLRKLCTTSLVCG